METIRLKGLEPDGTNKGFDVAIKVMPIGYAFKEIQVDEKQIHIAGDVPR